MKLHYHPLSTYSRKVATACTLRGEDIELHVLNVFKGELRSDEYRALSPFGKMPVLETPDGVLLESTSIIEFLEERGPRVLLPEGSERIARYYDRLGDHYLMNPTAALFWRPESDEAQRAPKVVRNAWALFAKQLEGRPFVAGDTFTLGDLSGAIATDYLVRLELEPPKVIQEWVRRCFQLDPMRDSLAGALPYVEKLLAERATRVQRSQRPAG